MWEKQDAAEVTPNEAISHECQQEGKEASFREGAFCLTHAASPVPCAEREGPLRGSEGTLGVAGWDRVCKSLFFNVSLFSRRFSCIKCTLIGQ